jgi:ATP-dependent DNA helicase MPH1
LSQPPAGSKLSVPVFAAPPAMRSRGVAAATAGGAVRSSPPASPDDGDYYMLGSFVVDDEAEISFIQSSEP